MDIATSQLIRSAVTKTVGVPVLPGGTLELPQLLRCLVLTWSDERLALLQSAAEVESWEVTTDLDPREFIRNLWREQGPLAFVDLPELGSTAYVSFQEAVTRSAEMGNVLVIVCGQAGAFTEEIWARSLGVWAYLPGDNGVEGFKCLFRDARQALARQAMTYVELDSYQ